MMPDPLPEEGIIGLSKVGSLMQNVEKTNRDADYELSETTGQLEADRRKDQPG